MKRTVIKIDENLCNGCGNCVSGCHEGALQLINGKAVMISDLYCDGLGACIGECPVEAISLEEREAEPYSETLVMERLVPKGEAVIFAHLKHLKEHNEHEWLKQGLEYLKVHNLNINFAEIEPNKESISSVNSSTPSTDEKKPMACGCPGSMAREIKRSNIDFSANQSSNNLKPIAGHYSELRQFPVQLHLLNPHAGFLQNADLLLAADCTAFACGNFHGQFLKGKSLAIACPKLDSNIPTYVDKLTEMIDTAKINTLTVLVMEVPCCQGLVKIAQQAREQAKRHIPIKIIVLSVGSKVIDDKWI